MIGQNPREIAVQLLRAHAQHAGFLDELLAAEPAAAALVPADRRLLQELAFGVVRWQAALDWLIARRTAGRVQKPALQILLRLGLYQLCWLDRIPAHAAVHETVEQARRLGFGAQSGFINAVLRGYARELEPTRQLLRELKSSQPACGHSHPQWLYDRWRQRWGADATTRLLEWNNTPPKTFARLNPLRTEAAQLLELWRAEGVEFQPFARDWTGPDLVFELLSHPALDSLPSFQSGGFYVQDPSTLLAVRELGPQPGETILDLCAAPGGKTTFAAQLMQNRGRIVAQDAEPGRLKRVVENCTRLGVGCVTLARASAVPGAAPDQPFDRVLVDAPCSNTGVLRRRVELRWRVQAAEIERLRTTQLGLLRRAAVPVKPGGTLVYSTCSLEPEENGDVVRAFLAEHPAFALVRERALLPQTDGVDGAYVARLDRAP